jgi:hypothetical protein
LSGMTEIIENNIWQIKDVPYQNKQEIISAIL